MTKAYFFTQPSNAHVELLHDSGKVYDAVADVHPTGRPGKSISFPDGTAFDVGCQLLITAPKKVAQIIRGVLIKTPDNFAYVLCDDFNLVDEKVCPEPSPIPPPNGQSPIEIINAVYMTGLFDLSTAEGCGLFTEACCKELHELHSPFWGYARAEPPKNNYNGHRIDAVQLLRRVGDYEPHYYDIIFSSESNEAKPSFQSKGPTIKEDWYYPAEGQEP